MCDSRRFVINPSLFNQAASWFKDKCNPSGAKQLSSHSHNSTPESEEERVLIIDNCDAYTLQRVLSYLQTGLYTTDDRSIRLPEFAPFHLTGFTPASLSLMSLLDGPAPSSQVQSSSPPSSQVVTVPGRTLSASHSDDNLISFEEDELLTRDIPKITAVNASFSELPKALDVAKAWNVIRVYHTANGIGLIDLRDYTIGHLQQELTGLTLAEGFTALVKHTFQGFQHHVDIPTPGPSSLVLQQCADNISKLLENSGFVDTVRGDSHFAYLIIRCLARSNTAASDQASLKPTETNNSKPEDEPQNEYPSSAVEPKPATQSSSALENTVKTLQQKILYLEAGLRSSQAKQQAPAVHPEDLAREMARAWAGKASREVAKTEAIKKERRNTEVTHDDTSTRVKSVLEADLEIGRLVSKMEKLQKELDSTTTERDNVVNQRDNAIAKLHQNASQSEQLKKIERELENVVAERDDYANELQTLEDANKQLRADVKLREEKLQSLSKLKETLEVKITELAKPTKEEGKDEIKRLQSKINSQDQTIRSLQEQLLKLRTQKANLQNEKQQLEKHNAAYKKRIETASPTPPASPNVVTRGAAALQANVERLEAEIVQLRSKTSEQATKITNLQSGNHQLGDENNALLDEVKKLQTQVRVQNAGIKALRDQYAKSEAERGELLDKLTLFKLEASTAKHPSNHGGPGVRLTGEAGGTPNTAERSAEFTSSPNSPAPNSSIPAVVDSPSPSHTVVSRDSGPANNTSTAPNMSVWSSGSGPMSFAARRMMNAARSVSQPTVGGATDESNQGRAPIDGLTDSMGRLALANQGGAINTASAAQQRQQGAPSTLPNGHGNHVQSPAASASISQPAVSSVAASVSTPQPSRPTTVPSQPRAQATIPSVAPAPVQQQAAQANGPAISTFVAAPAHWTVERERFIKMVNFLQAQLSSLRMSNIGAASRHAPGEFCLPLLQP